MRKLDAKERSQECDEVRAATGEACGSNAPKNLARDCSLAVAGRPPAMSAGALALLKNATRWASKRLLHGVKYFLPDYVFLLLSHRKRVGRFPNLKRPVTFNEMILWHCLHPDPRWAQLTDKLSVREYVRRKIGDEYLIPLVAVPDTFTQEVFDSLPSSFVMKANHGCGFVKVVWDKSKTSFEELNRLASQWLGTNFYHASRERHYRDIKPRIFFEKVLLEKSGKIPADLKLHVFGRRPGGPIIYPTVISDRFGDIRGDVYDAQWNRLELALGDYKRSEVAALSPSNWAEIVRIATLLAKDLGYVRVDLYSIGDKIYFGELTFTPGAGVLPFNPNQYDYEWGRLMKTAPGGQGHRL
jgi:hypothetical protein